MHIISVPISINEIKEKYNHFFENLLKIVVDLEKKIIAIDAELHVDLEQYLLESGSSQNNLWGANIYFNKPSFIEYTSLINIRPALNNKSMEIQDEKIKNSVFETVNNLITW